MNEKITGWLEESSEKVNSDEEFIRSNIGNIPLDQLGTVLAQLGEMQSEYEELYALVYWKANNILAQFERPE